MTTPISPQGHTPLLELEQVIDEDAFQWLISYAPAYANAIEVALRMGATPQDIRRFVSIRVGPDRQGLALRCEQAARHLQRGQTSHILPVGGGAPAR